jgi:hypothetical protein
MADAAVIVQRSGIAAVSPALNRSNQAIPDLDRLLRANLR